MIKIFAFCTNNLDFNKNKILDSSIANNFPGAGWIPMLGSLLQKSGFIFLSGDIALEAIKSNKYKAKDIAIIQEENSTIGNILLKKGAFPFLIFSGESPLFASYFYKNIFKISKSFKYKFFFKGVYFNNNLEHENFIFYFPSFTNKSSLVYKSWQSRDILVMVAANKFWKIKEFTIIGEIKQYLRLFRDKFKRNYYTYPPKIYSEKQLHDKRLELIEYFTKSNILDLYGNGWNNLTNLPKKYHFLTKKLNPKFSKDKLETISNYRFSLCIENMIFPGYVTEKIIDCLKCGVIPIYLGAPDIEDYIPENLFIDLRSFHDYETLENYLINFSDNLANEFLKNAYNFLNSKQGQKFTYEYFSENIHNLILNYSKNNTSFT